MVYTFHIRSESAPGKDNLGVRRPLRPRQLTGQPSEPGRAGEISWEGGMTEIIVGIGR